MISITLKKCGFINDKFVTSTFNVTKIQKLFNEATFVHAVLSNFLNGYKSALPFIQTEPAFSFVFQDPKSKFDQNWTKTKAALDLTCFAGELANSANWLCLAG